jgi:hypothetical protein
MFAKLLKHDFRSNALALSILSAATVGMGIAAGFLLRLITQYEDFVNNMEEAGEAFYTLVMSGSIISMSFCILGMIGSFVATFIILLIRYYRSRFTDQGYLTFTLPVKNHHIFLSAFLNIVIWMLIAWAALTIGITATILIGTTGTEFSPSDVIEYFGYYTELPAGYVVAAGIDTVVSSIYTVVIAMACITLASTWVKRNRILLAFGLYYGVSQVVGTLESAFSVFTLIGGAEDPFYGDVTAIYNDSIIAVVLMIIVKLGFIAGGYILSTQLTKKKLNLS